MIGQFIGLSVVSMNLEGQSCRSDPFRTVRTQVPSRHSAESLGCWSPRSGRPSSAAPQPLRPQQRSSPGSCLGARHGKTEARTRTLAWSCVVHLSHHWIPKSILSRSILSKSILFSVGLLFQKVLNTSDLTVQDAIWQNPSLLIGPRLNKGNKRKQCHSPRANQGNVQVSPAKLPEVPTYQAARVYLTGLLGFIAIPNGCRSSSAIMDRSEIYTRASQGHGCGTMTLLQTWTELHTMPHLVGLPASDALLALELATTCHVTEKPCAPEISPRL